VKHSAPEVVSHLCLLLLLEVGLSPVPQVLRFLNLPHLLSFLALQNRPESVVLEGTVVLSQRLESETVLTDLGELLPDDPLLETVESNLEQIRTRLLLDMFDTVADDGSMPLPLSCIYSQLYDDTPKQVKLAPHSEGVQYLLHEDVLSNLVDELHLIMLKPPLSEVIVDLKIVGFFS
jgi:hypothetical protein